MIQGQQPGAGQTIDIKVAISELPELGAFWIRDYPTHQTFDDLFQDCVNHSSVTGSPSRLEPITASRHFWFGDRMMLRTDSLHSVASRYANTAGRPELSLILRRDYYRVGPSRFAAGGVQYTYINAEDRIEKILPSILDKDQSVCCFDVCDWRRRRLALERTLASYELWPAWQDANEFPTRADLLLRPKTGWLAYALLIVAVFAGLGSGYAVWLNALSGSK